MEEDVLEPYVKNNTLVNAVRMDRQYYHDIRRWTLPFDENGGDEGFLIEDPSLPSNTEGYGGYVTWASTDVFHKTHTKPNVSLSFGEAELFAATRQRRIARLGWNGKGMYAVQMPGYPDGIPADKQMAKAYNIPIGHIVVINPHWMICNPDGSFSTWAPSSSDSMAKDYCLV